jgi:antitoxin PrlF
MAIGRVAAAVPKAMPCHGKIPAFDPSAVSQLGARAMRVTEKGQVTIPKHIRVAAGVLPGSEVTFAIDGDKIVISKLASGIQTDRRQQLRAAAAKARQSMSPQFRQMKAADVMAFLRAGEPAKP